MPYTAENIQIKGHSDEPWIMAIALAEEFNKPVQLIQRGLEACRLANVGHDYYIDRYLKGKVIPLNKDVDIIYVERQRVERG